MVASARWANPGHILILPNPHFENIYDLPESYAAAIHHAARMITLALKESYGCDGVSTRQHNEPGDNQDVWHYHLHVFAQRAPATTTIGSTN